MGLGDGVTVDSDFTIFPNSIGSPIPDRTVLDGVGLKLLSLEWDGNALTADKDYVVTDTHLEIFRSVTKETKLRISCLIYPDSNTELMGLYRSSGIYCTQNEPEGFRRILYYLDRPDILSTYRVKISASSTKYPHLLSNGNRIEAGNEPDGRHYVIWDDPFPKPTYLFAVVAGNLGIVKDSYQTGSGREISLEIYTNPGKEQFCKFAMESLKLAMEWDEATFHREYDLDLYMIVAVDDFNMGAMENKGLNIFNSKLVLASPETATDSIYEDILSVIAHEYFHNWTGNRVTLRDWFQLTLKEGLTVFRDQLFSQDMIGSAVKRIEDVDFLRNYQFPEDAGTLSHPIQPKEYLDIDNFYTRTVYEKGAEIIRMTYTILGRAKFIEALDLYFERHDGTAITTEDFMKTLEDSSGADLKLFRNWYNRKGTPKIQITEKYDESMGLYQLHWKDTNISSNNLELVYPVRYCVHHKDAFSESGLTIWAGESGMMEFRNLQERPILSLFQEFSAPVQILWERPVEDLHYLWVHDTDSFTRWDSGSLIKIAEIERIALNPNSSVDPKLLVSFTEILDKIPMEPEDLRFYAYLILLPHLTTITNLQDQYRIPETHLALRALDSALSTQFSSQIFDEYKKCRSRLEMDEMSRLDASGIRYFKNACLHFLRADEELLFEQLSSASQLTDEIASLRILSHSHSEISAKAFQNFCEKWKGNPLVMDHWLSLQASSEREDCLEIVKSLKQSKFFDVKNPNRVSSLLGSYARNRLRFHRPDGKGYEFLADSILELDQINTQSAARLAKNFSEIGKLPPEYQAKMRESAEKILSYSKLSNLVYEIVDSI